MNYYFLKEHIEILKPAGATVLFCQETERIYRYVENGSEHIVDNMNILNTGWGADTRWCAINYLHSLL